MAQPEKEMKVFNFQSPFNSFNADRSAPIDAFLGQFRDGIPKNEEGKKLIEEVNANASTMLSPLDDLFRQKLFGGGDALPSVDEVVKHGRRIIIVEPDGAVTNYTDKYLKNPTVEYLRELEKESGGKRTFGRPLLAHLGLFLGGKGDANLKNYDKAFGNLSPAAVDSKSKVFIDMPNGELLALTDEASKRAIDREKAIQEAAAQEQRKPKEELEKKTAAVEAKRQEIEKARNRYERLAHPEIPPVPREKNPFRRFFTRLHLAPHSAGYKRDLEKYNEAKRLRAPYESKKKEFEEMLKQEPTLESLEAEQKTAQDKLDDQIKKDSEILQEHQATDAYQNAAEKKEALKTVTDQYRKEKGELTQKIHEAQTGPKAVREKLMKPSAVEKIKSSHAVQFSRGAVGAVLDIIRHRELLDAEMKQNPPRMDEQQRQILKQVKNTRNFKEGVFLDNTPNHDVNKLVTLTDYETASRYASGIEEGYAKKEQEDSEKGAEPKDYASEKQHAFNRLARDNYNWKVESSKKTFQSIFGLEPTVENVQSVINSVDLDKYVKQGITQIDLEKYDPARHKLPSVNETNLGDMTFLLMSGIKTASLGPQAAHEPKPKVVDPLSQELAAYRPNAAQPQAQQPVLQ